MLNNPTVMRSALEVKAGRPSPQAAAQSLSQALNSSAAQVAGEGASLTERAAGLGRGVGATLGAINRGQVGTRQATGQLLTSPQQIRGTEPTQPTAPTPSRTSVPEVAMPSISYSPDPEALQARALQQANLRERAKRNPYIASTLLGGLGSAGLL